MNENIIKEINDVINNEEDNKIIFLDAYNQIKNIMKKCH